MKTMTSLNHKMTSMIAALAIAIPAIVPTSADARTKLVTLPDRTDLQVNLQHPWYSLMTETRDIPLQAGTNQIDFSWQGVSIDPGSILLTPLTNPDSTKIINVKFPPNENALTWEVYTPEAGTETVRVSYLLNGISRSSSYRMIVDETETNATFQEYFELSNASGERLEDASIRLNGSENLERSIEAGETRRFLVTNNDSVPISKLYISRPHVEATSGVEGEGISLVYEIENTDDNGLGVGVIPDGKVRIFGKDPSGSTLFLGEDYMVKTPVGESTRLSLGTVRDIVFKRRVLSDRQTNQRRNSSNRVILYDRVVEIRYEIENFKDTDSTLRIMEMFPPDAELTNLEQNGITVERQEEYAVQVDVELDARPSDADTDVPKKEIVFQYTIKNVVP